MRKHWKPFLKGFILQHSLIEKHVLVALWKEVCTVITLSWANLLVMQEGLLYEPMLPHTEGAVTTLLGVLCTGQLCSPSGFSLFMLPLVSCTVALILQFLQQTSTGGPVLFFLQELSEVVQWMDPMLLRDDLLSLCSSLLWSVLSWVQAILVLWA